MNLEEQLKMAAEPWLAEERLSPERSATLDTLVRKRSRKREWKQALSLTASAAAVIYGIIFWPLVVSVASGTPLVGPYIARMARYDQGAYWANGKGYLVAVGKSVTDHGYTLRVDSIVADTVRTEIYFTVDGPNLSARDTAVIDADYNGRHPSGGMSGHWTVEDGQITGSLTLPPLPYPTTQVELIMREVEGIQGSWKVPFMASRTIPDNLTRSVRVNQKLKGAGYDLTVDRLIIAPTETIIEVSGWAGSGFEPQTPELTADGQTIGWHGASTNGAESLWHPVNYRFAFDRIDGNPQAVTFSLGARRWQSGGPVLDLTRPGSQAKYGSYLFQFDSVQTAKERTTVVIRASQLPGQNLKQDFDQWELTDGQGRTHRTTGMGGSPEQLSVIFASEITNPVKLEAKQHAEPVAGGLSVIIPLK